MDGLWELANNFSNRTIPHPYGLPFPKIGGSQPQPTTAVAIISGTATDCKFGRYIHRVHPNKNPLKIWEKRAWAYAGTAQFFEYRLLSQKWVKL